MRLRAAYDNPGRGNCSVTTQHFLMLWGYKWAVYVQEAQVYSFPVAHTCVYVTKARETAPPVTVPFIHVS